MKRTEAIELAHTVTVHDPLVDRKRHIAMLGREETIRTLESAACRYATDADVLARALLAEVERMEKLSRLVAELEHDLAVVAQHREARASGGQHAGTGGRLGAATPSVLTYLDRLAHDMRWVLDGEEEKP